MFFSIRYVCKSGFALDFSRGQRLKAKYIKSFVSKTNLGSFLIKLNKHINQAVVFDLDVQIHLKPVPHKLSSV